MYAHNHLYRLVNYIGNIVEITTNDINHISKKWKRTYLQYLYGFGFDKKSANMLFEWGERWS